MSHRKTQRTFVLFGLQELPLAVFRKPHCFCTWTSSLFSLNQQSDNQQCAGNYTAISAPPASAEHEHFQVYHTPVLGETCYIDTALCQSSACDRVC